MPGGGVSQSAKSSILLDPKHAAESGKNLDMADPEERNRLKDHEGLTMATSSKTRQSESLKACSPVRLGQKRFLKICRHRCPRLLQPPQQSHYHLQG